MDDDANTFLIILLSIVAAWVFVVLFSICELGERMTYHFEKFDKELIRSDWYNLPVEMQRMLVVFLSDTQQPKNITCYGGVLATRETFKKVFYLDSSSIQYFGILGKSATILIPDN